jgi:hypothetical protein
MKTGPVTYQEGGLEQELHDLYKHEGEAAVLLPAEHGVEVRLEDVFKHNVHDEQQRAVQDDRVDYVVVDPVRFLCDS